MKTIRSGLSNFYGDVKLEEFFGNCWLVLRNYDGKKGVKVSREFATAWEKEFLVSKEELELD